MKITANYPSVHVCVKTQDETIAFEAKAENVQVYVDLEALALAGASIGQVIAKQLEAQLQPKS